MTMKIIERDMNKSLISRLTSTKTVRIKLIRKNVPKAAFIASKVLAASSVKTLSLTITV